MAYLLDQINAGGGGGSGLNSGGFGYFSFGNLTLSNTAVVFPETTIVPGYDIETTNAVSLSWPNLTDIDPSNVQGGYLNISGNGSLTSFSAPKLKTIAGNLNIGGNGVLTSISFPLLQSATGLSLSQGGANILLSNISLPSLSGTFVITAPGSTNLASVVIGSGWKMSNQGAMDFSGCALNAASVNLILHLCVNSPGLGPGTLVDVSGGTSAVPSGQGVADKATLVGQGVTVNTN